MSPETIYRMCTRKVRHATRKIARREMRKGGRRTVVATSTSAPCAEGSIAGTGGRKMTEIAFFTVGAFVGILFAAWADTKIEAQAVRQGVIKLSGKVYAIEEIKP